MNANGTDGGCLGLDQNGRFALIRGFVLQINEQTEAHQELNPGNGMPDVRNNRPSAETTPKTKV